MSPPPGVTIVQEGVSGAVPPERIATTLPLPLPLQSTLVTTVDILIGGGAETCGI